MFFREEDGNDIKDPFRPKSKFNPKNQSAYVEMYLDCIEKDIMLIDEKGSKLSNLFHGERKALFDLKNDKSIVIKEADKGSAVVGWDTDDYCMEADVQLSDSDVYQEITEDPLPELKNKIKISLDIIKD